MGVKKKKYNISTQGPLTGFFQSFQTHLMSSSANGTGSTAEASGNVISFAGVWSLDKFKIRPDDGARLTVSGFIIWKHGCQGNPSNACQDI